MSGSNKRTAVESLIMTQLHLDPRQLWGRASALGLDRAGELDLGYVIHTQLTGLFGDVAPRPFRVEERRGSIRVLGYATTTWEDLAERARAAADPAVWSVVRWAECASKPMPTTWRAGSSFEFCVRACPVVRNVAGTGSSRSVERDVYLARLDSNEASDGSLDRHAVYLDWLRRQLERNGACHVRAADVASFRLAALSRSRHAAGGRRVLRRPDVEFRGRLQVAAPDEFQNLVSRGVGRHRSFGFGMLLLRPGAARC